MILYWKRVNETFSRTATAEGEADPAIPSATATEAAKVTVPINPDIKIVADSMGAVSSAIEETVELSLDTFKNAVNIFASLFSSFAPPKTA